MLTYDDRATNTMSSSTSIKICLIVSSSCFFFFFSSRRRHTRFDCDWSSDVCSSDLAGIRRMGSCLVSGAVHGTGRERSTTRNVVAVPSLKSANDILLPGKAVLGPEIGRASCRERVEISGGAVSLKKKKKI